MGNRTTYKTTTIGLFAPPGAGKSTLAAGIFHQLKELGREVELVTEVAKTLVWSNRQIDLSSQAYVWGKQTKMIDVLQNQVEFIVCDSPPMLSYIYAPPHYPQSFKDCVVDLYKQYNTKNFFFTREKEYKSNGRYQDEQGSNLIGNDILSLLNKAQIPYISVPRGASRVDFVLDAILG